MKFSAIADGLGEATCSIAIQGLFSAYENFRVLCGAQPTNWLLAAEIVPEESMCGISPVYAGLVRSNELPIRRFDWL
jgi:hypothetical protein